MNRPRNKSFWRDAPRKPTKEDQAFMQYLLAGIRAKRQQATAGKSIAPAGVSGDNVPESKFESLTYKTTIKEISP